MALRADTLYGMRGAVVLATLGGAGALRQEPLAHRGLDADPDPDMIPG